MDSLRVGVVGVGALGRHHARLYQHCADAHLVGVYDVSTARVTEIADEFHTTAFQSLDDLIESCEALSVAVPTDQHYTVGKRLLEDGKHVLVEKPLASTVGEAQALVDLAGQQDVVLGVGHVERFNPILDSIQEIPGDPRFIEAYRLASYPPARQGQQPRGTEVSVIHDLMIHDIDVVLAVLSQPISKVEAVGVPVLSPTVDIANVRMTFRDGCVACLTASRVSSEALRKIRVFKNQAYLSLDYGAQQGEMATVQNGTIVRQGVPVDTRNALQEELEDFCSCILEKKTKNQAPEPRVSGHTAVKVLKVVDRITSQIEEQDEKRESAEC